MRLILEETCVRLCVEIAITAARIAAAAPAVLARIGDAVGNAYAAKSGGRHEQPGMRARASRRCASSARHVRLPVAGSIDSTDTRASSIGSPRMPRIFVRSPSAAFVNSASVFDSTFGSRAPPRNARSNACPSGARCGHFDEIHAPAVMLIAFGARHDEAGALQIVLNGVARKREDDRRRREIADRSARCRQVGIERAQQLGGRKGGNRRESRAARVNRRLAFDVNREAVSLFDAGDVRAEPHRFLRNRAHQAVDQLTEAVRKRSEHAIGIQPGRGSRRNALMTLPALASASTSLGNSARIDSRSTSPAWMPASSGSAM